MSGQLGEVFGSGIEVDIARGRPRRAQRPSFPSAWLAECELPRRPGPPSRPWRDRYSKSESSRSRERAMTGAARGVLSAALAPPSWSDCCYGKRTCGAFRAGFLGRLLDLGLLRWELLVRAQGAGLVEAAATGRPKGCSRGTAGRCCLRARPRPAWPGPEVAGTWALDSRREPNHGRQVCRHGRSHVPLAALPQPGSADTRRTSSRGSTSECSGSPVRCHPTPGPCGDGH